MRHSQRVWWCALGVLLIASTAYGGPRKNKMFDVSQYAREDWGRAFCAPTAVGNSFAWLAKEYGLEDLMKSPATGETLTVEEVIDGLGYLMETHPTDGTKEGMVEPAKRRFIESRGLEDKISVESMARPTKEWLDEQYKKGQDVEYAIGYYVKENGQWVRKGGHEQVYGDIPGEELGGHIVSLVDLLDPNENDPDSDFQISFTDPGRDDLVGQYGCIAAEQYWMEDSLGQTYFCTASTYNVLWEPDLMGPGDGGYILEGYQGAGDFGRAADPSRTVITKMERAWAESTPEPSTVVLLILGAATLSLRWARRRD